MGRRIGQVAGSFAFALMLGRLGLLLLGGPTEPPWTLIFVASALLGTIAWWLLGQMNLGRWPKVGIFGAGGLLIALRILSPGTLIYGVVPTTTTVGAIGAEMDIAFRIIQSGVAPVAARPGLVAILALVMWAIGGLFTYGSTGGPYAALFLPSLTMYFQFAVFDRFNAGVGWMLASSAILVLGVVSLALERHGETGRARDTEGRPLARKAMGMAATMAVFLAIGAVALANSASSVVSEYGNAPWRGGGSGYGNGESGIGYDGLVDLQQRVLDQSERPVFVATLGPGAPPADEVYWRVDTFDTFDGSAWKRSSTSLTRFEPGQPLANEYDTYQGPSLDFAQIVRIEALRSQVAPTAGVPTDIDEPPPGPAGRTPTEFQVLPDSALFISPSLSQGDYYQIQTRAADRTANLGALATGANGELTPMFAAAAAAGDFPYEPQVLDPPLPPPDLAAYLELPRDTPANIGRLARELTFRATSDYERGWILQNFFRDEGNFVYSTDVDTGHSSLDLNNWLTEPTSQNYRTGYCEQFAAGMGVMARTLGIPTRVVWGFTPGSVETQEDGSQIIVVRDLNAHAWVELWMEPFGWVQFDPTPRREQDGYAAQPASITAAFNSEEFLPERDTTRPTLGLPSPSDFGDELPGFAGTGTSADGSAPRWWLIGVVVLVPLLASIPAIKAVRRKRRLQRVRGGDITAAWDEIVDRLADLGDPIPESLTPIEVARDKGNALLPLAVSYASTIYGGRNGQASESDLIEAEWWIDRAYDGAARTRARMSLKSLLRR